MIKEKICYKVEGKRKAIRTSLITTQPTNDDVSHKFISGLRLFSIMFSEVIWPQFLYKFYFITQITRMSHRKRT